MKKARIFFLAGWVMLCCGVPGVSALAEVGVAHEGVGWTAVELFTKKKAGGMPAMSVDKDPPVRRSMRAGRSAGRFVIDGIMDEEGWEDAGTATDFVQTMPVPGAAASEETVVYFAYDDYAVYIGAQLFDEEPDRVLREFTERDQEGNYDWFVVIFDTYRDGQNAFSFGVTAAGTQSDSRLIGTEEDKSWDAVWESAVSHTELGWAVEIKIPFSMLRFTEADTQRWHINFGRSVRKNGEESFWSPVRPDIKILALQSGVLEGIEGVNPGLRLMLTPYLIGYLNESHHKAGGIRPSWGGDINGGVDLKLGVSKSFTLDAILIPDFGQVRADDQILNLSPFEVQFAENRQFFTEGVELFNRAGLFYSRRIGGLPLRHSAAQSALEPGEELVSNPANGTLLNASKLTGRTASGTGIGVFNAVERASYAEIRRGDGSTRRVLTGPLSNYNVLVVDQILPNAGFVSLTNTNVWREGSSYDANVSAMNFHLRNSRQRYAIGGAAGYSLQKGRDFHKDGYTWQLNFNKISGAFTYQLDYLVESLDYDFNDLGLMRVANERNLSLTMAYNWWKPFGPFQSAGINFWSFYLRLHEPNVYSENFTKIDGYFLLKNQVEFGWVSYIEFIESHDYYEPRTQDFSLYFFEPKNFNFGLYANSDYRKKLRYGANASYRKYFTPGRYRVESGAFLTYQHNNHFTASWEVTDYLGILDVGFVAALPNDEVILGNRNQHTIENTLTLKYAFDEKLSAGLRVRHYWTQVEYASFGSLGKDGRLQATDYPGEELGGLTAHDFTADFFTADLRVIWRYAPGSDISFVWKQSIAELASSATGDYFSNLTELMRFPQQNSFSLRLNYFLDYSSLSRHFVKNSSE